MGYLNWQVGVCFVVCWLVLQVNLSKYFNFKANWIMNVGLLFSKWRGRWKRCLKFTLFSVIQIFKYEIFNLLKYLNFHQFELKYFKANWVLASSAADAEGALTAAKLHESYFNLVYLQENLHQVSKKNMPTEMPAKGNKLVVIFLVMHKGEG